MVDRLADEWREVEPTEELRILASLISQRRALKAADALQLAATLAWCEGEAQDKGFVCLDDLLWRAAQAEGFRALPQRSAAEIEAGEVGEGG